MREAKLLLFIIERGGYPVHAEHFTGEGHRVLIEPSMRKALARLKSVNPDVIVAEFNFGPRYGDRISNLEPLLAWVQTAARPARVIALVEPEYRHHVETLRARFPIFDVLVYPLDAQRLRDGVEHAAAD